MTQMSIPDQKQTFTDFSKIQTELKKRGIYLDRWAADQAVSADASQDEILTAYSSRLEPFMKAGGYQSADVISVNPETQGIHEIRQKFLSEHTHSEDEIRFFIEGQGLFWFNVDGEVLCILCTAGDLISVPANTKHWFDLGPTPYVKAIRIFTNPEGWVARYTGSGIDENYNPKYS
ncbi:MAG: 1,2-dihydroxy-3-keto-5-methylthiopentene dioxygenase [Oligoflexus sp.]